MSTSFELSSPILHLSQLLLHAILPIACDARIIFSSSDPSIWDFPLMLKRISVETESHADGAHKICNNISRDCPFFLGVCLLGFMVYVFPYIINVLFYHFLYEIFMLLPPLKSNCLLIRVILYSILFDQYNWIILESRSLFFRNNIKWRLEKYTMLFKR